MLSLKERVLKIKKSVQDIDPNSFIVIHEVKEAVGGKFGLMNNKLAKKAN